MPPYTSHWPKQDSFLSHTSHSFRISRGNLFIVDWSLLQREDFQPISVKHSSLEIRHILFSLLSRVSHIAWPNPGRECPGRKLEIVIALITMQILNFTVPVSFCSEVLLSLLVSALSLGFSQYFGEQKGQTEQMLDPWSEPSTAPRVPTLVVVSRVLLLWLWNLKALDSRLFCLLHDFDRLFNLSVS